jgi:tRNA A-37 threonylcarbamoyl transferase component Bud32/membrane-associated phospholipid phosphatase
VAAGWEDAEDPGVVSDAGAGDVPDAAVSIPKARLTSEAVPGTARTGGLRRRPTGAPPPLPRKLGTSGKVWLGLSGLLAVALVAFVARGQPLLAAEFETGVLRSIASLRTEWLSSAMRVLAAIGSGWSISIVGWGMLALLITFKRWRHLFTFFGSLLVTGMLGTLVYLFMRRPRPYGVTIIGDWTGFAAPSLPMLGLAACLIGFTYSMVVPGRPRNWAKLVTGLVIAIVAFARLYLGVDHPSDIIWGIILGVAIPLAAFRWFTPNEAFPVTYRRGKTAHLDVTGRRGDAIRQAISDQLGLTVLEIKPIGLAASGGSTPLRLRIAGDPDTYVFAKLYAKNHVRADRWYKLGRTILYGALEDEASFQTVRRFVQYEDYTLRLMQDMKLPAPAPYGVVEITPEREYLIVMEFFEGAAEISEVEVTDEIIDEGLLLIRKLWDAGLAHRDIKPGNLMVRDGKVLIVDAFFVQVRPSPWRQAVDLGNMMLVLAVKSDPERVYRHALKYFTPAEIAEAFAATRGVASPTQLRLVMKQDGRDLVEQFRRLAPERRPIGIQRWSVRRVALTAGLAVALLAIVGTTVFLLTPRRDLEIPFSPTCEVQTVAVLMAQSVPTATEIPCIEALPAGLSFDRAMARNGEARFWLNSDRAGDEAVIVTLAGNCDTSGARPDRVQRLAGGCVTYDYSAAAQADPEFIASVDTALGFLAREDLVAYVEEEAGLPLCGAGTTCPGAG